MARGMNRVGRWALVLLVMMLGFSALAPQGEGKPLPPVTLLWQVVPSSDGKGAVQVRLSATVMADMAVLSLLAEPSRGVKVVSGALEWEGAVPKGETRSLDLVLEPGQNGRVAFTAQGRTASNVHFTRRIDVFLDPESVQNKPHGDVLSPQLTPPPGKRLLR